MNNTKKIVEITGNLVYPIMVGESAFVRESGSLRRTSTVLSMESPSQSDIRFETQNTNYLLHLVEQEVMV